ncbi:hypothetical protein HYFRA_00007189 [Hymenoscyphus fraxineus]|uniref:Uncharacterized protein n=1 Tax=Hymenoscyphus fraxineus TaxID=746836 RepID=A0A9N9KYM6_9HELO|nr:hypothetical protein HYFRA_00007189 [Hymenoscyphus fraxineus]
MGSPSTSKPGKPSDTVPSATEKPNHKKLPRLPESHKIVKRPLLHPPISSPYSASSTAPKVIYVKANASFIATIKRVRHYLAGIENRISNSSQQKAHNNRKGTNRGHAKDKTEELRALMNENDGEFLKKVEDNVKKRGQGEEVILQATGKAISKLLSVAAWLENEANGEEFVVRIRTKSVATIDDVVVKGEEEGLGTETESRIRRTSCLEVRVRLKGV